jgi:hypothetical protein
VKEMELKILKLEFEENIEIIKLRVKNGFAKAITVD